MLYVTTLTRLVILLTTTAALVHGEPNPNPNPQPPPGSRPVYITPSQGQIPRQPQVIFDSVLSFSFNLNYGTFSV